jgi:hypothetical protein
VHAAVGPGISVLIHISRGVKMGRVNLHFSGIGCILKRYVNDFFQDLTKEGKFEPKGKNEKGEA